MLPASRKESLITARLPFDNGFTDRTPYHYRRHSVRVLALISYIADQIMNAQSEVAILAYLRIWNRNRNKRSAHGMVLPFALYLLYILFIIYF
jgi:hypothetical protein